MDTERFRQAPCYLCGYNGRGYYDPAIHSCVSEWHEQSELEISFGEEGATEIKRLREANARLLEALIECRRCLGKSRPVDINTIVAWDALELADRIIKEMS